MVFKYPELDESINIQNWVIRVFQNWMTLLDDIMSSNFGRHESSYFGCLKNDPLKIYNPIDVYLCLPILEDTNHPILDAQEIILFWMLKIPSNFGC